MLIHKQHSVVSTQHLQYSAVSQLIRVDGEWATSIPWLHNLQSNWIWKSIISSYERQWH